MKKSWVICIFMVACSSAPKTTPTLVIKNPILELDLNNLDRPFIVQNIATLTIRGYAFLCEECLPTMIFQAPLVVGKDEIGKRSILGSFTIFRWQKFYVDIDKEYLPWNTEPIATIDSPRSLWGKKGAFGWYTAILEPNAHSQWLHGTIGWASEGDKFIVHEKNANGNWIRVKSKGCSRVSNATISFIKNYFPVGTPVFKIYAQENIKNLSAYNLDRPFLNWDYEFLDRNNQILEKFSHPMSALPEAFPTKNDWLLDEKKRNPYEVPLEDFNGTFWVDLGLIENYKHPKKIIHNYKKMPDFFIFSNYE